MSFIFLESFPTLGYGWLTKVTWG